MNDSWPSTHLSLLLRVKDPQNADAWSDFVARYRAPIVRFCPGRFNVQEAVAEDVAQEILIGLIKEMQRFEYQPDKSFRGWLKTVTKNSVLACFRKEKRRLDAGTGNSNLQELLQNVAETDSAEQLAEALSDELERDLLQEAERLVRERVDKQTWRAYRGRVDGQPAREVAAEINMKVAAVHKAKSRVLQMVREEIAALLGDRESS